MPYPRDRGARGGEDTLAKIANEIDPRPRASNTFRRVCRVEGISHQTGVRTPHPGRCVAHPNPRVRRACETMGDGLTYGWHRRGVPIPYVALVAVMLFLFGRITSPGMDGNASPVGLPNPTLSALHAAGDVVMLKRVETAEREVEQYKALYMTKETELSGLAGLVDGQADCVGKLQAESEAKRALAREVETNRKELAEKLKTAAKEAALGVADMTQRMEKQETNYAHSGRDIPFGREFEAHATGETGNAKTTTLDFQVLSWEPHAVLYRNFASLAECGHVKSLAEKRLAPSGLALRKGEKKEGEYFPITTFRRLI